MASLRHGCPEDVVSRARESQKGEDRFQWVIYPTFVVYKFKELVLFILKINKNVLSVLVSYSGSKQAEYSQTYSRTIYAVLGQGKFNIGWNLSTAAVCCSPDKPLHWLAKDFHQCTSLGLYIYKPG